MFQRRSRSGRSAPILADVAFCFTLLFTLPGLLTSQALAQGPLHETRGAKVDGSYVVVFDAQVEGLAVADEAHQLADRFGGQLRRAWTVIPGAHLTLPNAAAARALARQPRVAWVEEDAVFTAGAVQPSAPWHVDRIDQRDLPLDGTYTYGGDGSGVHIYVVDSGIRDSHAEFGARASRDFDAFDDGQNGNDCLGHGTHVAAIAGGATWGVAKDAQLHGVRVLDCSGFGTLSSILDGVDWVAQNRILPAVVNMSFSGDTTPALDAAIDSLAADDVFVVAAASNDAFDACQFSPAGAVSAYTVAAVDATDTRADFSNFGDCVDLFAPGMAVTSAWSTSDTASADLDGTSQAAPAAAGLAAIALEAQPALTAAEVRVELHGAASCGRVGDPQGSINRLLHTELGGRDPACPAGDPDLSFQNPSLIVDNFPRPVTVTARNDGTATATRCAARITLPPGVTLTDGENPQPLADLAAGGTDAATWTVHWPLCQFMEQRPVILHLSCDNGAHDQDTVIWCFN